MQVFSVLEKITNLATPFASYTGKQPWSTCKHGSLLLRDMWS